MADEAFEALMAQANQQQTQTENTEMVNSTVGDGDATNQETQTTETQTSEMETVTETETSAENTVEETGTTEETPTAPAVDYNEWVKNETGGLFETVDQFKASLDKFKGFDEQANKLAELEKNQLPDDGFVKKLAEMRSAGASKDQISAFIKLNNEYDDFSEMEPKDLKVAKLVLIDGYSQAVAQRKVDKEFNLSDFDEGTDEYQDAIEELRISSKGDLQALEGHKAKLSTVENKAEKLKLEGIALRSAHEQNVKQTVPSLLGEFKGLGALDLSGKVGKEEVTSNLSFDYDEEFSKNIPGLLEDFFSKDIAPITPEKVQLAKESIQGAYLVQNITSLLNNAYKTGLAVAAEKSDNKFVNNNGVKETENNPNPNVTKGVTAADWEAFGNRVWPGGRSN